MTLCLNTTLALTHIALHCPSVEESLAFYQDYCNLRVIQSRPGMGATIYWLAQEHTKSFVFVLLPKKVDASCQCSTSNFPTDISHYGFECRSVEQVDSIAEKAKADNRLVFGPKQMNEPTGYIAIVRSPEGRCIEFSYGQEIVNFCENS
ncbi:hypothetical protein RCL1_000721 [Eukaryota sp. TZLM3-RCL]